MNTVHEIDVFDDEWDAMFRGDKPFAVVSVRKHVKPGHYLELRRVRAGWEAHEPRFVPDPWVTPNGEVTFFTVCVTYVTVPGAYGVDVDWQVVGFRRLGF